MLPGFRFLFAAILLTVSLLVFGLGAAALLRSAHQEFATIPTRLPPAPMIVVQQPIETPATLAMLRLEPRALDATAAPTTPAVTAPVDPTPAESEKTTPPETVASIPVAPAIATAAPVEAPKAEPAPKLEATIIETVAPVTVAVATAPVVEPTPAPALEIPAAPPVVEITAALQPTTPQQTTPQPTATLTDDDAKLSSSKIAMLGGPPVDTEPVPLPKSKPVAEPVKKVVKKRVVVKKRRVAARPVATAAAPQPADPFGLPVAR